MLFGNWVKYRLTPSVKSIQHNLISPKKWHLSQYPLCFLGERLWIMDKFKQKCWYNNIWALLFFLSSLSLFSLWQLGNVTITGRTANIMTPIERVRDKTLHGTSNFTSFLLKTQNTSTMVEELLEDLQLDYWQFLDSCSSWRQ